MKKFIFILTDGYEIYDEKEITLDEAFELNINVRWLTDGNITWCRKSHVSF